MINRARTLRAPRQNRIAGTSGLFGGLFGGRFVSLFGALGMALAGCGGDTPGDSPDLGEAADLASARDGATSKDFFIRVHYRLQGAGDVKTWGMHFWGAGSTSPNWGSPQTFSGSDAFGGYTDIKVTSTGDTSDAWLGLLPVQCSNGNCKKDVETGARFVDLTKNAENPNLAECWITQGQTIQTKPPAAGGLAYKISRPKDFIDLGNGSVRLLFRVAPGSTGKVEYGTAQNTLDKSLTWDANADINTSGLLLSGLTIGTRVFYRVTTNIQGKTDTSAVLDLTPTKFSTIADAADFATWGQKGVMYQLLVRTFADGGSPKAVADKTKESGIDPKTYDGVGDLVGLRNKLPYLKELGADAIWMTPVFKSKSYHGYDTTDFYDLDPAVGTLKDFQDLTAAAHALGIKIILDLVQNHVADVNPWFTAAVDPKDQNNAAFHDWFVWSDEYSNMYTDKHPWDASAVIWACKNYQCYHQIFGAAMPELNFRNPEVRAKMKDIAGFWISQGADGYRLDASKHIDQFDDNNGVAIASHGTHVWWKEFNYFVKKTAQKPMGVSTIILAGENRWDDPADFKKMVPYAGDMDSQFDFPFRSVLANLLGGKTNDDADLAAYVNRVQTAAAVAGDGGNANHFFERFLSNHDLTRPATQFSALMPNDAALKLAITAVLTIPGMPVIYYGEEFGKKGQRDRYVGNEPYDHDEFIREPMSWYKALTFTGDKMKSWDIDFAKSNAANAALNLGAGVCAAANPDYRFVKFMADNDLASWAAQKDDPSSLFSYYKKLIALRKSQSLFTDTGVTLTTARNDANWYVYGLSKGGSSLQIVLSRSATAQTFTPAVARKDLLTGDTKSSFTVPAYGVLILQ